MDDEVEKFVEFMAERKDSEVELLTMAFFVNLGCWAEKHRTEIQYALTAAYNDDCDKALLSMPK